MFLPLSHPPGHAQCDYGEARVIIGGVERKAHYFALDLPHSDGGVSDASWKWERSQDNMTWTAISGATSNTYAPVEADEGNYLRATVVYTDGHGSGKGAQLAFADPVPLIPNPPKEGVGLAS